MINETLFGQQYLSVTLDEGHIFRNVNAKHSAARLIMKQARVRLVLTATPLHTSTKVSLFHHLNHGPLMQP